MPIYDYRAKDKAGNTITGTLTADDEHAAADMIRELGHLPMEIRKAHVVAKTQKNDKEGSAFARYIIYPLWTGVNIKMLALFYRQLATMLNAGMSLSESLRSQENRARGRFRVILAEMRENVSSGGRLSETMVRYPNVFSSLQIALVRAGESGGLIERMIDRIAIYLEYELKVRSLVVKAMIYPSVILVFAGLMYVCLPNVSVLMNAGFKPFIAIVGPTLLHVIIGVVAVFVVFRLVFQFYAPRFIWDCFKVNIPLVGGNARKIAMSRFSRALAVLYASGMSLVESVSIAADASGNLFVGRAVKYAVPTIQSGQGLTESLARTKVVSPVVLDMLTVGERSGSIDAVLEKVADYMDDEVDAAIHKISIALFVTSILVAAVIVCYIAANFYLGYFGKMLESVNK